MSRYRSYRRSGNKLLALFAPVWGRVWFWALIGSVVLAILVFSVGCFWAMGENNSAAKQFDKTAKASVTVRYFTSDDYENAGVMYMRVTDARDLVSLPVLAKDGSRFLGYFDNTVGTHQWVDASGNWLQRPSSDLLLYPLYEEE